MRPVTSMATGAGRTARVVAGISMMVTGLAVSSGGIALAIAGVVPVVAGAGNVCLLAPFFGQLLGLHHDEVMTSTAH